MQIRKNEVYIKVKNFEKMRLFYEKLLNCKAKYVYKNRWATIDGWLGLYNPWFDVDNGIKLDDTDKNGIKIGNNAIICFLTDDLEESKSFLESIGAYDIGETLEVNNTALYRYFHFRDPEGNILEMGKYE